MPAIRASSARHSTFELGTNITVSADRAAKGAGGPPPVQLCVDQNLCGGGVRSQVNEDVCYMRYPLC
jgi:hypothetical protein